MWKRLPLMFCSLQSSAAYPTYTQNTNPAYNFSHVSSAWSQQLASAAPSVRNPCKLPPLLHGVQRAHGLFLAFPVPLCLFMFAVSAPQVCPLVIVMAGAASLRRTCSSHPLHAGVAVQVSFIRVAKALVGLGGSFADGTQVTAIIAQAEDLQGYLW